MKKVLFGHSGQFGDLFMNEPSIRALKKISKDHYTMPIYTKYLGAAPLFYYNDSIDDILPITKYELDQNDFRSIVEDLRKTGYSTIYNPMAPHKENDWFTKRHQVAEVAYSYGLDEIEGFNNQIKLNKWWGYEDVIKKTISFHPFPGNYTEDHTTKNPKKMSLNKCQEIVDLLIKKGYSVIQLGHESEPELKGATKFNGSFFESVKELLKTELFIGFDSGLTWAASGYKHPVLAMYCNDYYTINDVNYIRNIQPVNPNAKYIDKKDINLISIGEIEEGIKYI